MWITSRVSCNPEKSAGIAPVGHKGGVLLVNIGVILGRHMAAAAPHLVAHAPVFYVPGFFPAVLLPQFRHRAHAVVVDVLHPVGEFFHFTAPHVAGQVRLCAYHFAQVQKVVGAEAVVLGHTAPPLVHDGRPVFFRAYAVFPVVGIGKTAARPAQHGHFKFFQGIYHVFPHAIDVGDGGVVFTYVKPAVNTPAEVLGKMAVDVFVDGVSALVGVHVDGGLRAGANCRQGE